MDDSGGLEGEGGRLSGMWSGMPRDKIGWFLVATHPQRSTNAKEAAHEGTYNMQPESLMLSGLRLYWQVIW
ncbi:hypothetical protein GCM10008922_28560 [Faecalicatena contorta]